MPSRLALDALLQLERRGVCRIVGQHCGQKRLCAIEGIQLGREFGELQ